MPSSKQPLEPGSPRSNGGGGVPSGQAGVSSPLDGGRGVSNNGQGPADVYPLRDFGNVECHNSVELVVFRFVSFGRLAHLRRWLLALPHVTSARIAGYVNQTALFSVAVTPGTSSSLLVPPGTRLISSDGRRVELCVDP
jgi:hypothetical protein